ncbi:WhiB family transcriptional regulator [bacterium]|nr:WhiB family transcriptional regulator [bacterium]
MHNHQTHYPIFANRNNTMMRQPLEYENPACATVGDPDSWFEENMEDSATAKRICKKCPHLNECADYGIRNEVIGIWGALSTKERAHIATKQNINRIPLIALQPMRGNR